jgi:hypothetical protein
MGVESLLAKPAATSPAARATVPNQPVRQSVSPAATSAPAGGAAPTKTQ